MIKADIDFINLPLLLTHFLPIQGALSSCMIGSNDEWHMNYASLYVYLFRNIESLFDLIPYFQSNHRFEVASISVVLEVS